jgi:2-methylcitrate dehydratase PrpD
VTGVDSTSKALADFAAGLEIDAVPDVVLEKVKLSILDGIGAALLSSTLAKSKQTARAIRIVSTGGKSTAWGWGFKASPLEAALLNGMLTEGLDYSDIHVGAGLHPTSVILPAVVAYGETGRASGEDVLLAHLIGCEAMIRLGLAAPGKFHARGFQPTSIIGAVGAALATGKMAKLTGEEMLEALSLGTTLAFGSSLSVRVGAYFGGIDSGRAAESGILAAMLAKEGISGIAQDAIEGRFGFMEAHAGTGNYDLGPTTAGLGKKWEMKDIFHKRYPTSYACTSLLDAATRLRHKNKLDPSRVAEVKFGDNAGNIGLFSEPEVEKRRPSSIYVAKTSHYFILALALNYGNVSAQLLQDKLKDKKVLQFSDKITYALDEKSHWVEVKLKNGDTLREEQDVLEPSPEAIVRKKYIENSIPVIGGRAATEVESMIDDLEGLDDIKRLTALLKPVQLR